MASEVFPHLKIPLEVVVKATNNFHPDNKIGHGDFGTVYIGQLEWSGKSMKIAARRLDRSHGLGGKDFLTEVSMLSNLKHPNIVSIIGFCEEENGERIIVTTYEPNGSLEQFLDSPDLTWTQRLKICVGAARALTYLHADYGVLHRFINSSTILVDESWEAKLSGFEFSIKQSVQQMNRVVLTEPIIGTNGYMDPATIKAGGVTSKSDIYSFGIVLFELLCGRKAYIQNDDNKFLVPLVAKHYKNKTLKNIIHPDLCNQMSPQSLLKYSEAAYSCLKEKPSHRPDMNDVYAELQKALEAQTRREKFINKLEHLKIRLIDIKSATNNFSDATKIRETGFYTLYTAQLDHFNNKNSPFIDWENKGEPSKSNNTVVIKRMEAIFVNREDYFFTEIEMLCSVKHINIATILGFSVESDELILVTENVSKLYLHYYLGDEVIDFRRTLSWEIRLRICIDVAKALSYLHSEVEDKKIIINRNVCSDNIGLDENWRAMIVEFGFSLFLPPDKVNEGILTEIYNFQKFYTDPKLHDTMKIKRESEVYSFGVVLFEILSGRRVNDPFFNNETKKGRAFVLEGTMADKIDHIIMEETQYTRPNKDSIKKFIEIATRCLVEAENQRPTMEDVVKELEKALAFQEKTDIEQDVNKLENTSEPQLTLENILEERLQDPNTDQHVDKLKKASEDRSRRESFDKKFEHLRIGFSDIEEATDNFSPEHMISMDASCRLYRVPLKYFGKGNDNNGTIKRITSGQGYDKARFYKEVEMLNRIKHPNIVTLLGFCDEGSEMILLIDDVSNGPLGNYFGNHSKKSRIFTWEERLKICIDVAHALRYLHYEIEEGRMMLINRFISSRAIVLDKNWVPKIIDFGYAIFQHSVRDKFMIYELDRAGPLYVRSPEYKNGGVNRKTDVYCFGVLLFQILCGRALNDPIYLNESSEGLAGVVRQGTGKLESMIDPAIMEEACENSFLLSRGPNKDSLDTFINIAYKCIEENYQYRPTMEVVVEELEKSSFSQKNNKDNPIIPLEDIVEATENFKHYIGKGGFGKVYIGKLRDGDGYKTIVAKKLDKGSDQGKTEFFNELEILLKYKHENVIGLVGYCNDKSEKIIVYEYASRESLDRHLKDPSLTWIKRLNICIDVATALEFLHGGVGKQAKVIHRDIKTENILVNDDWKGKLADFGLSLISPITHEGDYIIEYWCGTPGYVDPIYQSTRSLTLESDIYSFGVVLFEILCGKSTFAINHDEGRYLPDFIKSKFEEGQHDKVVFEHIREQISPESLATFQEIAYQCLQLKREKRPTMKEVLRQLKNALEFQNMASTITKCAPLQIPLEDVVKATNNFHHENIIRQDGFGQLYKGRLLRSGNLVNITARKLDRKNGLGDLEFWTEVTVLSDLKHANLVSVIGFCESKDERIIVTMNEGVNGNLSWYLTSPKFTWTERLRICVGVARALCYLHHDEGHERDYRIIHRLITSFTIWFDENWEAKLSTFEYSVKQFFKDPVLLCKPICPTSYMDPSVEKAGGVTHKSDIYSFGVVLFELLCGREAYVDNDANRFLAPLAKYHYENNTLQDIILPSLWNQMSSQSLVIYSNVAYSCLQEEPEDRPDVDYIVAELEKASSLQNMASTITKCASFKIPLEDVIKATNNFHHESIIKQDRFAQLYKGRLLQAGNLVNITARRFDRKHGPGDMEFWSEVNVLSDLKHTNLVSLIGFCNEKDEKIILCTYGVNGRLRGHLNSSNLTWEQRLKICIGAARALSYLRYDEGRERDYYIIHRIINSSTILLDENWEAKLSSFEYSVKQFYRDQSQQHEPIDVMGYMDPSTEKDGFVSYKSDIYSFGVVLFEILCGREAYIHGEADMFLAPLAKHHYENETLQHIILPGLWNQMSPQSLLQFSRAAYSCLDEDLSQRRDMYYIVTELENALTLQNMASTITKCAPLQIPLEDVVKATNNFHHENITGQSRFGQFYKGRLLQAGNLVNISARRLDRKNGLGDLEFWTEVTVLSDLKHTNIVSIIGFCESKDERIIVTTSEAFNGSLSLHLNSPNLTWTERLRICVGVARALSYLHHDEGRERDYHIIHRYITSDTIVLDENWEAKLNTFEFSVKQYFKDPVLLCKPICPTSYMDPSVEKTGGVTHKSDIYSFGVVLFELLCGRVAYIENDANRFLAPLAKYHYENNTLQDIVPPSLWNQMSSQSLVIYSKVAYSCLQEEPEHRPDVDYIVAELEKAFSLQLNPEVESNEVEESNHASMTEIQADRLPGELNSMTTTGESENSKIQNKEKMLPDQTNDSANQSGCCWPCGFRKVAKSKISKR